MIDDEVSQPELADGTIQFQLAGGTEKLTDWKSEPDLQVLKGDLEAAKTAHNSQIAKIKHWDDLLAIKGDAKPPKIKGRSSVQPKLIRRQAEWRYAALSEPFLSSDKLFKVEPVTFEDGPAARQNALLLNHQFRNKFNRVKFVDDFVRATVDEGTCIVRLGWKRSSVMVPKEIPVFTHYPIQDQTQADALQQALELKTADPRTYDEQVPPEIKACVDLFEEQQVATFAVQTGVEMTEEEKILENRPTAEVMNPANFYVDPSCGGDLDKALFAVVSFETNQAELKKEGDRYTNLDQVNWEGSSPMVEPDHATMSPDTFAFKDQARKKVVAYEYWGFYDINGNGSLVPFVATWIGNTIIRMEENPFPDQKLPFVMVPYLPMKRELYGEPDAEMLEDNQKVSGAVMRGMIDLLGQSANGQKGFARGMLDPVNRRKYENGQDYEFNPGMPPKDGVITHTYPELPQSALTMFSLQNQEAEALTGVKSFSGGLSGDAYGNVATNTKSMLDAAAKREMAILRRLAMGMSEIGRKILAMNSQFLSEKEVVRVTNEQFVEVKREELAGEFDLSVDISTFEVDNSKAQDLGFMLQTLGPNMDPSISMTILAEIAELKRMPILAHKLRNWQPPPPDPMQEQMKQLELQKLQFEVQKLQSEAMLNQAKAQEAMSAAGKKELDRIEQETGTTHARKIVEQQAQAGGNQHLEILKSLVKPRKEGESAPDINAAIGYNTLSDQLEKQRLFNSAPTPAITPDNQ